MAGIGEVVVGVVDDVRRLPVSDELANAAVKLLDYASSLGFGAETKEKQRKKIHMLYLLGNNILILYKAMPAL